MLFISYAKKPEPKIPKLPFGVIRKARGSPLTRDERRAFLSHRVFGRLIRSRIFGIAGAQFNRLVQDFNKTKKGAALDKRLKKTANWSNKLFGQRKISPDNPAALDEKTRQLLSKPKVKKNIVKYYSDIVRYYRELLKFAEKQRGIFPDCIAIINKEIEIAEEDLTESKPV